MNFPSLQSAVWLEDTVGLFLALAVIGFVGFLLLLMSPGRKDASDLGNRSRRCQKNGIKHHEGKDSADASMMMTGSSGDDCCCDGTEYEGKSAGKKLSGRTRKSEEVISPKVLRNRTV